MLKKAQTMNLSVEEGSKAGLTAKEMDRGITWQQAHKMVRADLGPFNWILVNADPHKTELHNAGAGSVMQMKESLDENEVLYGLLRMGFGKGTFRRTKWIFIHWSGSKVGAVKRGKANGAQGEFETKMGMHHLSVSSANLEDFSPESLIDRIKRAVVVDGGDGKDDDGISMEAFLAALAEEQQVAQEEFGAGDGGEKKEGDLPGFEELVHSVQSPDQPFNWCMFAPK